MKRELRQQLIGMGMSGTVSAVLGGAMALYYAYAVEPNWLDENQVTLTLPRLAPEFDGYRIAQFSDLHMERWDNWTMLDYVVEQTNAHQPDLIVITGDFVDRHVEDIAERLTDSLRKLRAPDGVLGVVGNHDYWGNIKAVRRMMEASGIQELSNTFCTIHRGDAALHIAGVDSMLQAKARLDLVLAQLPPEGAAILLAHEPDFVYITAPTRRFDLQLSGHSHGGQVRIPIITDFVLPPFSKRYVAGLGRKDGTYVYTNRGLGVTDMPLRFNCRPELTLFTLRAQQRAIKQKNQSS